ncbi:MAG: hypothetical protein MUF72_10090 [Elainella sp. Prado103]|nr:hypothetical protein [Elainella sp. Prado103]
MKKSNLILPGDPEFNLALATPPPNWQQEAARWGGEFAFIVRAESGLLEPCSFAELDEYLEGGEYDERLATIDDDEEAFDFNDLEHDQALTGSEFAV